jgi:hypothetical protein
MFSLFHLDDLAKEASKGIARLNSDILRALGKRIALAQKGGFDRILLLTEADKEADALYMAILRELDRSTATAGEVFSQAARLAYEGMNKYYAAKGLTQIPIEQQRAIVNFVNATASNTKNTFTNLSNTSAIGFRVMDLDGTVKYNGFKTHYHNLVDQAISEVATGQVDYGSAIRNALKQTADSGIRVLDYQSGYSRRLDSAMKQNVLDGVKDIAHEVSRRTGEEFGADGVEIDAHNYCAPDHLPYQGRQFTNKEFEDIQNSLPRQFEMWNCRHTVHAIILGLSEPLYTEDERQAMIAQSTEKIEFEGKEYTRYEATQLQRKIETAVRQSKDRAIIFNASGDDVSRRVEQLRINQLKDKYGLLSKKFGLPYASDRMAVSGFRAVSPTIPGNRKTVGFSFLSGETKLKTTRDALNLGNSAEGWNKHEQIFRQKYLKTFNLKDDLTKTIGYWGGPEPSFNAAVSGTRENFIAMAKQWGKDYNQQAMAVLLPDKRGAGGKVVINLGKKLSPQEWDVFFAKITDANKMLVQNPDDYIGVTTKSGNLVEYWFGSREQRNRAHAVFSKALKEVKKKSDITVEDGYLFKLLFAGDDY